VQSHRTGPTNSDIQASIRPRYTPVDASTAWVAVRIVEGHRQRLRQPAKTAMSQSGRSQSLVSSASLKVGNFDGVNAGWYTGRKTTAPARHLLPPRREPGRRVFLRDGFRQTGERPVRKGCGQAMRVSFAMTVARVPPSQCIYGRRGVMIVLRHTLGEVFEIGHSWMRSRAWHCGRTTRCSPWR